MKLCLWIYQGTPSSQPVPWTPTVDLHKSCRSLSAVSVFYSCLSVCLFGFIYGLFKFFWFLCFFISCFIHFKKCLMPGIFLGICSSWWMILKMSGHFRDFPFTRFFRFVLSFRSFWGVLFMQVLGAFDRKSQGYKSGASMIFWSCIFPMLFAF